MRSIALALLLVAFVLVGADAWSRPGGGQSFSGGSSGRSSGGSSWSGGSSGRSSGGSSWGGGSSDRSSGGSSWSFGSGGSSKSSTSDTGSYSPSSYRSEAELERQREELERMQDDIFCMQQCTFSSGYGDFSEQQGKRTSCETTCKEKKRQERAAAAAERQKQRAAEDARLRESTSSAAMFPVVLGGLFVGAIGLVSFLRRRSDRSWASGVISDSDLETYRIPTLPAAAPKRDDRPKFSGVDSAIAALKSKDEAFSFVLFEDFAHALYVEAHTLRGRGKLAQLVPYLHSSAQMILANQVVEDVSTIIVGSMRVEEVRAESKTRTVEAKVRFIANYTERNGGVDQSYYVEELWTFTRDADVVSRPPERSRVIDCPNCGAPLDKIVAGTCRYCDTKAGTGNHDWFVTGIRVDAREARGPMLTGTTEEVGTDFPTQVAHDAKEKYAALVARDPKLDWRAFTQRVDTVFYRFHETWSAQDLAGVRPFLSDNLFEAQQYWIAAYKAAGLRNISGDPTIIVTQLSRVTSDKYFDSLTVRIYAQCFDYTVDTTGKQVGGSRIKPRQYSEYWTFIRGAGSAGAPRTEDTCPNCGADAAHVNMAGSCGSCGVKITNGAFDWVLSRIEQDEVYEL